MTRASVLDRFALTETLDYLKRIGALSKSVVVLNAPGSDKKGRVVCSTMGSSEDLENEGYRRLLVNSCYWAVGLEDKVPDKAKVDLVGTYKATSFKKPFVRGVKPSDHAMKE